MRGAKPTGYSFRSQLAGTLAQQISIEASQPKIDLGVLDLSDKVIVLGVIDLQDHPSVESVEVVEARIRRGLKRLPPRGSSPRPMRYEGPVSRHGVHGSRALACLHTPSG